MKASKSLIGGAIATALLAMGCDVEQTEKGSLPDVDVSADSGQIPKYDVDVHKTQEGKMPNVDIDVKGGNLPEYDIEGPDIHVGTKEMEVEVPDVDVDMKTKTITVPDVDVDLPDDDPE